MPDEGARKTPGRQAGGSQITIQVGGGEFGAVQGVLMSYIKYRYKKGEKTKSKYTMRVYSSRRHRLKRERNQTVWSVNNHRCGTAASKARPSEISGLPAARVGWESWIGKLTPWGSRDTKAL